MKKYLFVALLAMMCLPSMAQRVALRYGMNITLPKSEQVYGSTLGQSLGLTYEQSIKGRFAISAGAYLTDIAIGTYDNPRDCFGGEDCPEKMRYTYRFFQVPVNLVWDATPKGISEWQFLVNGGYVFTQWISGKNELFYGSTTATVALEKLPKAGNYPGFGLPDWKAAVPLAHAYRLLWARTCSQAAFLGRRKRRVPAQSGWLVGGFMAR